MITVEAKGNSLIVEVRQPTREDLNKLNEIGQAMARAINVGICAVQTELNVNEACAEDVWYLRTRERHTPELEQRLIQLHKSGFAPANMMEWPGKSN